MKLIFSIALLLFTSQVFGHEAHETDSKLRQLGEYASPSGHKVYLVAREDGHLLGQPYQLELRADCGGDGGSVKSLPIQDSFSVCDMDPDSIKMNIKKTAIAMKVKLADIGSYDQKIAQGQASPEVSCLAATTIKKFSLKNLCSSKP